MSRVFVAWDHPRSRGEHAKRGCVGLLNRGSSPLTRGAHSSVLDAIWLARIIPAHAGSTVVRTHSSMSLRDHPRSRGEHWNVLCGEYRLLGSSPLTRGALRGPAGVCPSVGIIPAHAGSTTGTVVEAFPFGDHPRSRGEHTPHV